MLVPEASYNIKSSLSFPIEKSQLSLTFLYNIVMNFKNSTYQNNLNDNRQSSHFVPSYHLLSNNTKHFRL